MKMSNEFLIHISLAWIPFLLFSTYGIQAQQLDTAVPSVDRADRIWVPPSCPRPCLTYTKEGVPICDCVLAGEQVRNSNCPPFPPSCPIRCTQIDANNCDVCNCEEAVNPNCPPFNTACPRPCVVNRNGCRTCLELCSAPYNRVNRIDPARRKRKRNP